MARRAGVLHTLLAASILLTPLASPLSLPSSEIGRHPQRLRSRLDSAAHETPTSLLQLRLRGGVHSEPRSVGASSGGPPLYSLVDCQRACLDEILAEAREEEDDEEEGPWRAVLYDDHWRDVLSMAIRPTDLG
jgi:hypothetical protein